MSLFSSLFGSKKQSQNSVDAMPIRSLQSIPAGADYYKNIQDRLAGRGVGYGDAYNTYANPQMANMRNYFQGYALPELKSDLSLTGRRQASSGSNALESAYRNEGSNENNILAQLSQRNTEVGHQDVNNALSAEGQFAQNEANMKNAGAQADRQSTQEQLNNESQRLQNESAGYRNLFNAGADLIGNYAIPGMGSMFGGGGGFGSTFSSPQGNWSPSTNVSYGYNQVVDPRSRLAARYGQSGRVA